jgi:hypothetical protein
MLYQDIGGENRPEFTAYRLLYYIYTQEVLGRFTNCRLLYHDQGILWLFPTEKDPKPVDW